MVNPSRRAISGVAPLNQRIAETSVPVSAYIDDGTSSPDRKVISVDQTTTPLEVSEEIVPEAPIEPLTDETYESMNTTMRMMTLKGKVAVITG